ncbi:MAG TPA: hypothetical protein VIF60_14510 [Burkholderiaceae bacterium]
MKLTKFGAALLSSDRVIKRSFILVFGSTIYSHLTSWKTGRAKLRQAVKRQRFELAICLDARAY